MEWVCVDLCSSVFGEVAVAFVIFRPENTAVVHSIYSSFPII